LLFGLSGDLQELCDGDALPLERLHRVAHARAQVAVDHRFGQFDIDEFRQLVGHAVDNRVARLVEPRRTHALGDRRAPFVDGLKLVERLGNPLVGGVGQSEFLHFDDLHGEVGFVFVAVGHRLELLFIAGAHAGDFFIETFGHPTAADFIEPCLHVEPRHRRVAPRCRQIERHLVAARNRSRHIDQRAVTLAFVGHHFFDFGVGRSHRTDVHAQTRVARDGHDGAYFHLAVERDRAAVVFGAVHVVDLRRGDDVDVVFFHGLREVLGHGIFDGLCTGSLLAVGPEMCLDHSARSLARTETRDSHLSRELAERDFDVGLKCRRVDCNVDLYFVAVQLFDRALHE